MPARIVVIEDDPNTLDLLTYLIRASGHTALSAADGRAGLALIHAEQPDLIVCDIQLPGLDGFDIARTLAADRRLRDTPLIAVTALAMVGDREKILAAGFDGYLSKPIAAEAFVAQLERFLPAELRTDRNIAASSPGAATILIVDDRATDREYMAVLLAHRHYQVVKAGDAAEALEILRHKPVDLLITDILMPTMDGYELVRRLRQSTATANLPVIFYTAHYNEREARNLADSCGVARVLTKPSPPDRVLQAVDEVLAGKAPTSPPPEGFDERHLVLVNNKLLETTSELERKNSHLAALVEMSVQLSSERDPQTLLANFAAAARYLVAARQAVVSAHAADQRQLRHIHVSGMGASVANALETSLRRDGAFAEFFAEPSSFRRRAGGDPREVGLPAAHPPVHSLLVSPIRSPSHLYGWVCATDKLGLEEFTEEDERLLDVLAALVGRIYENGGLYAELQQRADELRQSEESFRYLFRYSPLPMWVYSMSSLRFLEVNDVAVANYGYSRDEFLSMTLADVRPPEDVERLWRDVHASIDGFVHATGWRHRRKDGQLMDVEVYAHDIQFGGEAARLGLILDVTARKETERQLIQSQKMEAVGQLTGGVAHDFNNILMVIMANVDALEEEESFAAGLKDRIGQIAHATDRAAGLTRQLLAFSRKQPLRPQVTNVNDLVSVTGKLLRRTLGEQIEIESILADDLWTVDVDRTQLETTLVNLCINARDAMPEGGRLLIETANAALDADYASNNTDVVAGDYAMLAVTDTGIGIATDQLSRVFEPFFTTKAVGKGTGLGLSMVYGFIKQSNGHISIYSEVGRGTTIKMYLPRHEGVGEAEAVKASNPPARGTERVLVVEDNDPVRANVVQQLTSLGYSVAEATNGAAALAHLEADSTPYDLLLTDMVMPGSLDGKALADQVAVRWPRTHVLLMSGYTENAMVRGGQLDRDVRLLAKPFRKADLAEAVRGVLDGNGAHPTPT